MAHRPDYHNVTFLFVIYEMNVKIVRRGKCVTIDVSIQTSFYIYLYVMCVRASVDHRYAYAQCIYVCVHIRVETYLLGNH